VHDSNSLQQLHSSTDWSWKSVTNLQRIAKVLMLVIWVWPIWKINGCSFCTICWY